MRNNFKLDKVLHDCLKNHKSVLPKRTQRLLISAKTLREEKERSKNIESRHLDGKF